MKGKNCLLVILSHLLRYDEESVPSFLENKSSMMRDLEDCGWPVAFKDIRLLEKEITQGRTYLEQSRQLRETSERVRKKHSAV